MQNEKKIDVFFGSQSIDRKKSIYLYNHFPWIKKMMNIKKLILKLVKNKRKKKPVSDFFILRSKSNVVYECDLPKKT